MKCTICEKAEATQKLSSGSVTVYYCDVCVTPMVDLGMKPIKLFKQQQRHANNHLQRDQTRAS